ncbi:hypothetical protein EH222_12090 [candidate division KSB1 bacterium]|nr:MAG: hypothetical protein EH222_12090 [candidate division KSB1 bacterium]
MLEQEKKHYLRQVEQKSRALMEAMRKAYEQDGIYSRIQIDLNMGQPNLMVDIVDPAEDDKADLVVKSASEREQAAYHLMTSAIIFYSDLSPMEARTIARLCLNAFKRDGLFDRQE